MPYTIARLTECLVCCLRRHIEEEEELMALRRPDETAALQAVHQELLAHAEILLGLLDPHKVEAFEPQTAAQAGYLIRDLRAHLAHEEARTRPLWEGEAEEPVEVNEVEAV